MHIFDVDSKINRKDFITQVSAIGGTLLLTKDLLSFGGPQKALKNRIGLAQSLYEEYSYKAKIEGKIPREIRGSLYRNGPGMFDRNGLIKNNILDGDGMILSFSFKNGKVHYKNRFVRTEKFIEEQKKGKFIYSTWTTLHEKPSKSQAGVTVFERNGKLYAFDEYSPPYVLDPKSLKTLGDKKLNPKQTGYQAHTRFDTFNGDWVTFGFDIAGLNDYYLNISVLDKKNKIKKHISRKLDKNYYVHDFYISENYIIIDFQPAVFEFEDFFNGKKSLAGTLKWHEKMGNKLYIFERKGTNQKPIIIETKTHWSWHTVNAYEEKGNLILENSSYENPYHFIYEDGLFASIMRNEKISPKNPRLDDLVGKSYLDRMIVDLKKKSIRHEPLYQKEGWGVDFPMINLMYEGRKQRYGYFAISSGMNNSHFLNGLMKMDMKTGKTWDYVFGKQYYIGEPIFVSKRGFKYSYSKPEPGWLLSLVYNDKTKKSFLAVMDVESIEKGPIAKVHLKHHVPLSFHGQWVSV